MLDIFKLTCNRLSIEMAKIKSADVEPLLSSFANFTTKSKKCSNVLWIISIFLCLCEYVCASVDLVFFHSRALTRMHKHRHRHRIAIELTRTTNTSHIESCMACSFCRFLVCFVVDFAIHRRTMFATTCDTYDEAEGETCHKIWHLTWFSSSSTAVQNCHNVYALISIRFGCSFEWIKIFKPCS